VLLLTIIVVDAAIIIITLPAATITAVTIYTLDDTAIIMMDDTMDDTIIIMNLYLWLPLCQHGYACAELSVLQGVRCGCVFWRCCEKMGVQQLLW
jgi:hypothetical protein